MDDNPSMHPPPSSSSNNKSKRSVSSFVSESFARFDSTYPQLSSTNHHHMMHEEDVNNNNNNSSSSNNNNAPPLYTSLIMYLPLLVLSICRSTYFGAFSLLRTLVVGFIMRLILDALKFSVSNSLYERMIRCWSEFRERCSDYSCGMILRQCLVFFDGDDVNHLESSQQHQQHDDHQNNQQQHNQQNGGSSNVKKNTLLQQSLLHHHHPDYHYYYKDVIKYWPIPPGLTLLTLVTGLAFVIHPDGITWIIVGKLL
eukprot:scaffold63917_cov21-Cyclotella_meneghiniana.AAC.1